MTTVLFEQKSESGMVNQLWIQDVIFEVNVFNERKKVGYNGLFLL